MILVVFLFLRSARATLIPASPCRSRCIGTFGVMYLLGFSLNNLSLMALTIATGFVVDDAIVVLENISATSRRAWRRFEAALQGAREVGFTVLSISLSLVAVFIPILFMGGIVGRLFREFAVTLSVAIVHLARGLAHHHADDVRAAAAARRRIAGPGACRAGASAPSSACAAATSAASPSCSGSRCRCC